MAAATIEESSDVTEFVQYPYEALQAVGSSLSSISDQVSTESRNAFEVTGFTPDQDRINGALDHFRSEWQASLVKLGENISGFGELSASIGSMSGQFDNQLASSMSPGGSHAAGNVHGPR